MALNDGQDPFAWFLLALANGQRGQKDRARNWFDKAVARTLAAAPEDLELRPLWAEAAGRLGLPGPVAAGAAALVGFPASKGR